MRIAWIVNSTLVCLLLLGKTTLAAESEAALAQRIFGNADKNNDDALDDKEVLEAKRIFKAAVLQGKRANDLPGGKNTLDKIQDFVTKKGKLDDNKNGKVTKQEWLDFVKEGFKRKESIIKEAKDKLAAAAAAAKKKQEEQNKIDRLRREKEQLEKKLKQQKKKK